MRDGELSPQARQRLLLVARQAIEAHLAGQPYSPQDDDPELRRPCGAFVTLRRRSDGDMRGCVGQVEPERSLLETVARAAVVAATADRRFRPVALAELADLAVQISALGPVEPVAVEAVEVGRHGLIIQYEGRSGLLLPQVALDYRWDRETFLAYTCRKAGLPGDTWRKPGCEVFAFTATFFVED